MSEKNNTLDRSDNTHRSLKRLVVVDAIFRRSEDNISKYTLHADVIFNEERLSGGGETSIVFSIAVLRCEVVFVKPSDNFNVDRNSVRRQKPIGPQEIIRSKQKNHLFSGGIKAALKLNLFQGSSASYEGTHKLEETVKTTHSKSVFNEQFTRSTDGHDAWRVDGNELKNGRLSGPIFDFESEPRLTLIDMRNEARRLNDAKNEMNPLSRIEVRCLRDDIDVYDVRHKNEEMNSIFSSKPGHNERMQIARGVIREALLAESLSVSGLLDDPYAEMTICDVTIPIIDQRS